MLRVVLLATLALTPIASAVAATASAVAATPSAAAGTPMVVNWPTWLRAAPSANAAATDEIPAGFRVDVLDCADGWCRVLSDRAPGYLPQSLLAAGLQRPLTVSPGAACIKGTHQTPERAIPLTICPAQP